MMDLKDQKVTLVQVEHEVQKVNQVHRELQVHPVSRVNQVHRESKEKQVPPETEVRREK